MKLKTEPVRTILWGHGLECVGSVQHYPIVTGTFAADPVTGSDGAQYAVFTIPEPENGSYPALWAGTYRMPVSALQAHDPDVFEEL